MATNLNITEKTVRRKSSLLELAGELGNVSKACKIIGYSRQQFYEIRRDFQTYGAAGLLDKASGCKGAHPNRVSDEIEKAILDYCLEHPTHGPLRVSQQLNLKGIIVSSGGVTGVWTRHNLMTKNERLLRLEKSVRETPIELNEEQTKLLERFSPEFRDRHIEVTETGELVAIDTFFTGTLKGIGKVYMQSALDCSSKYVWSRLYTNKLPVTAVQLLNNDVLPFFEANGIKIQTVLTDNGREYCGKPESHPFELFLQLEDIEHRRTRVRRPQSNGFVERWHRTVLDEHFRIKGRTKFYESVEEMQNDLDVYLEEYNQRRAHQGRGMNGRTPAMVFAANMPNIPDTISEEVPEATV